MLPSSWAVLRKPRALLVDLDDTLFDHRRAYVAGLRAMRDRFPAFRGYPLATAIRRYRTLLDEIHPAVLRGELSELEGRRQRFRRLFEEAGLRPSEEELGEAMAVARAAYLAHSGTVRGARGLLNALRPDWTIVVVSNHLQRDQEAKLTELRLSASVDGLITSEAAGAAKPDPRPFVRALELARVSADRAVVLGDSWESDVIGAKAAGIRPVWLNRYARSSPDPRVTELSALVPIARALAAIRARR
jgi:HAD superfamily hydrolase (TIGR01549 family)